MARTRIFGWDLGSLLAEGAGIPDVIGAVSQESSIVRLGIGGSLKAVPASGAAGYWNHTAGALNFGSSANTYLRVYIRVTVLPATARRLISSTTHIQVRLDTSGTLSLLDNGVLIGTSSTALSDTGRWYMVEVGKTTTTNAILRIEGVQEVSGTCGATQGVPCRFGSDDTVAATYTAYFDDASVDDAALPGHGKVIKLAPVADIQVGTWTGGAGGVTNLFEAVNNFPPIGTATETDLTQIESIDTSPDNATDEYRVAVQSYIEGGISSWERVVAVGPILSHGEDSGTGTKTGSMALIVNPAVGVYGPFTYGDDLGALGTWPSNWSLKLNSVTDSPSVTMSTRPQIAVRKTDTGSRVASVSMVALKVEYDHRRAPPWGHFRRNYIIR